MTTQHLPTQPATILAAIISVLTKQRAIACVVILGVLAFVFASRREPPEPSQEDRLKELQVNTGPFIAGLAKILRTSQAIERDKQDETVTVYFPDHVRFTYDRFLAANREYETIIPPLLEVAQQVSAGDLSAETIAEYEARKATYFEKAEADKQIWHAYETVYLPYVESKFPLLAIDILNFVTGQQASLSKEQSALGAWVKRHYPEVKVFSSMSPDVVAAHKRKLDSFKFGKMPAEEFWKRTITYLDAENAANYSHDIPKAAKQYDDAQKARLSALLALKSAALPVTQGDTTHKLRPLQTALKEYKQAVAKNDEAARMILTNFPVGVKNMTADYRSWQRRERQVKRHKQVVDSLDSDFPIPEERRSQRRLNDWIRQIDDQLDPKNLGVSWLAYRKMRQGMDYYEVCDYIGSYGQSQSEAGNLTTYAWRDGLRTIVATFRRSKLVGKSQVGL